MEPPPLEPGTVLAGKYRLGHRLGEGGMGTVYLAEHLVLKANVAVKVIDKEVVDGEVTLARFMREAQAAASLRSPHVVQIIDYGTEGERPFMVMELLEGETLAQRLERVGRLTPQETYRVISHVARAVAKAHEAGIVHRDLKPDNVFLVHNEGDEIAKVLDFGVAKIDTTSLGGHSHTRTGSLLGTPYYMSPEQAQGNKEIDYRSDLWALGVIAFECMLGQRPFSSDGLGDLVIQICIRDIPIPSTLGDVPEGFDAWFARAVAREPEHRFQSAREVSEALGVAVGLSRAEGVMPEPAWSVAGGALPRPREASRAASPDALRTRADVARPLEETMSDVEVPRASRWEVVPRSPYQEEPRPRPTYVTEPPPPSSGFWSIVLVALLALVLGGGGVFLLREAGVTIPGIEARPAAAPPPRPTGGEAPSEATP
ncbi:MAG TPA: serine/threonine-protein kinase, partial [Polyangiaceae bacterium]|nr:serine/threonine-protein kinase [Polyangiaceae bacterium]